MSSSDKARTRHDRASIPAWIDMRDSPPSRETRTRSNHQSNDSLTKRQAKHTRGYRPHVPESKVRGNVAAKGQRSHSRQLSLCRSQDVQRSDKDLATVDPSILSATTTTTRKSDSSGGSDSTITQRLYDRRRSSSRRPSSSRSFGSDTTSEQIGASTRILAPSYLNNLFAAFPENSQPYLPYSSCPQEALTDSTLSTVSDSSSRYSPLPSPPTTPKLVDPSRRSTFNSGSGTSGPISIDDSSPNAYKPTARCMRPSVADATEDDEDDSILSYDKQYEQPQDHTAGLHEALQHELLNHAIRDDEALQQDAFYEQHHYFQSPCGPRASYLAPSPRPPQSVSATFNPNQSRSILYPPSVTAGPQRQQRSTGNVASDSQASIPAGTIEEQQRSVGYDLLAQQYSGPSSTIKPVYRKFEYLNHRILLHLQDELSELEEQLHSIDEAVARYNQAICPPGVERPASRRLEAYYGSEIHHRRTQILGLVFTKLEQYNKTMHAYATMTKETSPSDEEQVAALKLWMQEERPVHEAETRFLDHQDDLIVPRQPPRFIDERAGGLPPSPPPHLWTTYVMPLVATLPLLASRRWFAASTLFLGLAFLGIGTVNYTAWDQHAGCIWSRTVLGVTCVAVLGITIACSARQSGDVSPPGVSS